MIKLPFASKHGVHRSLAVARLALRQHLAWRAVVRDKRAHSPSSYRPGQLGSELRFDNAPREEQFLRHGKDRSILQKERPALRIHHLETLVCLNFRIVGTDLAEIRVYGHVKRERIVDNGFRIE